jgi:polyphosphate kinase
MSNPFPPQSRFINRELSWLAFNRRVLEEARDPRVPLAERAKFLAIVANNLDEFVMVRLAGLMNERNTSDRDAAGFTVREQLSFVQKAIAEQVGEQYEGFSELSERFARNGVTIVRREDWTRNERLSMQAHFREGLEPMLTPLAVEETQGFPLVGNLRLYVAFEMEQDSEGGTIERFGVVPVPSGEPRLVALGEGRFALLEDVLAHCADEVFPGWRMRAHATFRVTRDATVDIDEDHANDLLSELEEGLWVRGHGATVRLELEFSAPRQIVDWLCAQLKVVTDDLVFVAGPLDLTLLFAAPTLSASLPGKQFPAHEPAPCPMEFDDPFAALQQKPLLLHHPYQSFAPVVELLQKAAIDPRVVALKQTLYRVSGDSPLVHALVQAAMNGKQVTVLCELRARFDERRNIAWAKRLEQAGATVLYGVLGYKVHAKLLLIIRREDHGIRRYVHMGTGNYNDKTARVYEDFSYLTADEAVGRDVSALFNMLTGFSRPPSWARLLVAPLTFRKRMEGWIQGETERAREGKEARIFAKMNSLVDADICELLYAASQAGVQIDLVVRGICILRPGIPGLSENIRVISVVGRFLEHSRLFYFRHGGRGIYVIGSGDWMTRNLDRRVESLIEVREPEFQAEFDRVMDIYLSDTRSARELGADGVYVRRGGPDDETIGVQERFIELAMQAPTEDPKEPAGFHFRPARKPSDDAYG